MEKSLDKTWLKHEKLVRFSSWNSCEVSLGVKVVLKSSLKKKRRRKTTVSSDWKQRQLGFQIGGLKTWLFVSVEFRRVVFWLQGTLSFLLRPELTNLSFWSVFDHFRPLSPERGSAPVVVRPKNWEKKTGDVSVSELSLE